MSTPHQDSGTYTDASVFHGRHQGVTGRPWPGARRRIGREPTTIRIEPEERLVEHAEACRARSDFDPRVTRLLLPILAGPVVLHEVRPDTGVSIRPPKFEELPAKRVVFYGTSITHGAGSTAAHLTYPHLCSNWLGTDALNLGVGGACHCEPEFADYLAQREDWDAAVLALSVNMMGFTDEQFAQRVQYFVHTVAGANPQRPVFAVTLWSFYGDLPEHEQHAKAGRFRQHLRDAVASCPTPNARLLEGPDLLTRFGGLTGDLIHPGDTAMIEMSWRLAEAIRPHLLGTGS